MTKKIRVVKNHVWNYHIKIQGSPPIRRTEQDTDEVDAVFRRRRPNPLTPTTLQKVMTRHNPSSYPGNGLWSDGRPAYQAGTDGRTIRLQPSTETLRLARGNAAKKFYSDLDLGETFGSLRETASMVHGGAKRIHSFYGDVKRVGLVRAAERVGIAVKQRAYTKDPAQAYLVTQFGWLQLAQDAYNAVSGQLDRSVEGTTVRGHGRSSANGEILGHGNVGNRVFLSGVVRNRNLRDLNRLGLANPARTAWQLTRLSFVLDWWIGLANTLAYYSWDIGMTDTFECVTSSSVSESQYLCDGSWQSWRTITVINRSVGTPALPFRPPLLADADVNIGIGQSITLLALLRNSL